MPTHLGTVRPGSKIRFPFSTADSAGGLVTMTNLVVGDIKIYKDGTATVRGSTGGYAVDTSIDAITAIHWIEIDLSSDSTGDFYKAGSRYDVYVADVTVDGQEVQFAAGTFLIGYPGAVLDTWIEDASLSSQTVFDLTAGPAEDNALNGSICVIHDLASAVQFSYGIVSDYDGTNKRVTLAAAPTFTIANKDNISFFAPVGLIAVNGAVITGTGGTVDANVVQISGDTTAADTMELFAEALDQTTGQLDSGSLAASTITATSIAADAITAAKIADGAIDAATFAAGAITATAIAANAVTAAKIDPDVTAEFWTTALTESYGTDGSALTGAQILYGLYSGLFEFAISGTTKTNKKLDGSTTAFVQTLDSATDPTSTTRSS
jgi:hypothetical protein